MAILVFAAVEFLDEAEKLMMMAVVNAFAAKNWRGAKGHAAFRLWGLEMKDEETFLVYLVERSV